MCETREDVAPLTAAEESEPLTAPTDTGTLAVRTSLEDAGTRWFSEWHHWAAPFAFAITEAATMVIARTTVIAVATRSVYGNTRRSTTMQVHVWAAVAMWLLGAVQIVLGWLRRGRHAWIHRTLGYLFLGLWVLFVGPTSAYLSLMIQADTIWGTPASTTLLDVTAMSYYTFYRAWRVARLRRRGTHSLKLHGNLMSLGCLVTMAQIPQRLLMLLLLAMRECVTWPLHLMGQRDLALALRQAVTEQTIFSFSMMLGSLGSLVLIDGPRGTWAKMFGGKTPDPRVFGDSHEDESEMYAYDVTACHERWKWRARLLVYAIARGWATAWWSRQPEPISLQSL